MAKVKLDPEKRIGLYNRDFDETRALLDMAIQEVWCQMLYKGMCSASVSVKIDFKANREIINDDNAPTGTREAVHPEAKAKVSFTLQHKGGTDVEIIPKGSDEILMDDSGSAYLVSKEEASGQLCMFNSYDEYMEAVKGD